jgi:hypothetical protein
MFPDGIEERAPVGRNSEPTGYDVVPSEFHNLLHLPSGKIGKQNGPFLLGVDSESNEINAVVNHRPIFGSGLKVCC